MNLERFLTVVGRHILLVLFLVLLASMAVFLAVSLLNALWHVQYLLACIILLVLVNKMKQKGGKK